MSAAHSLAVMFLQGDTTVVTAGYEKWLMIFAGVVALSLLVNAIITAVAGMKAMQAIDEVKALIHDLHGKTTPILQKSNALIDDLTPKVRAITENVTQISYTARVKTEEVGALVSEWSRTAADANAKTRQQVAHVDRMVSSTLTTTEEVANTIVKGIKAPVTQVAGWVAGLRTGLQTLVEKYSKKGRGSGRFDF